MRKKAVRAVGMEDGVAARDGGEEEEVIGMEEEASMLAMEVASVAVLASFL